MKQTHLRIGILVASLLTSISVFAEPAVSLAQVKEFNQLIQKNGMKWKASETWVSRLSSSEVKRMLGSNEMPESTLDYEGASGKAGSSIDWRNQNGVNWVGPVLNQGNCGSCVAFASVATLEAQVSISSGLPWLRPTFSPQQLFACGGGGCEMGWTPGSAGSFLESQGVVDSACAPYTMGSTGNDVSCAQATCTGASERTYKILNVKKPSGIFGGSVDAVKQALAHGPLMTTLTVHTDFLTYSGGIYKSVGGATLGGHAVSIVGYDDTSRSWTVRNSWGPDWGENGFIRVSWDDRSGVGSNTWQFEVPASPHAATIQTPAENEYVSGHSQFRVSTSSTAPLDVELRAAGSNSVLTHLNCVKADAQSCVSDLDTSTLSDGRYEMSAKTGNALDFSQVRSFYVVNHAPAQMTVTYKGHDVDLTKPLKDRPEFDISTRSGAIPLHSLTFLVRQNGKVIAQRRNDVVLPEMKFGFRTNSLPNGVYEILFHGEMPAGGKMYTVDTQPLTVTFSN